jgi:predicted flavoprotein YhiN
VDLLPGLDASDCLQQEKRSAPRTLLRTVLGRRLPRALAQELEALWWADRAQVPLGEWSDRELAALAARLNAWELKPAGTEGYRTAEVTLGGVDTRQLSSRTMEAVARPGLYFIGEVVDVTGHLGGFNFQWAWSSGHAAGEAV